MKLRAPSVAHWKGSCLFILRYTARTAQWASYRIGVLKNRVNAAQCTMSELLEGMKKGKKTDCLDFDWKGSCLFILRYNARTAQWTSYSIGVL